MKGDHIEYYAGYKYQLNKTYSVQTRIIPTFPVDEEYIKLDLSGLLSIKEGYAWDGPSGPTFDTPDFMRGSLVHDALYQLMRDGFISEFSYKPMVDELLRIVCLEDGMSNFRAAYVWEGVNIFGGPSADPADKKPVITAP